MGRLLLIAVAVAAEILLWAEWFGRLCSHALALVAYVYYLVLIAVFRTPPRLTVRDEDGREILVTNVDRNGVNDRRLLAAVTVCLRWYPWNLSTLCWFLSITTGVPAAITIRWTEVRPTHSLSINMLTGTDIATGHKFPFGNISLDGKKSE